MPVQGYVHRALFRLAHNLGLFKADHPDASDFLCLLLQGCFFTDVISVLLSTVTMRDYLKECAMTSFDKANHILGGNQPAIQILKTQCSTSSSNVGLINVAILSLLNLVPYSKATRSRPRQSVPWLTTTSEIILPEILAVWQPELFCLSCSLPLQSIAGILALIT